MKKICKRTNSLWFLIPSFVFLTISNYTCFSQENDNSYHFNIIDTTEQYPASGFCNVLNYLWDQGVIDSSGNIHFVYVHNYKLFCYSSEDEGVTWSTEQIITGKEGHIRTAMLGLAPGNKKVIVYTVDEGYINGTVSYGYEFAYDLYGAVENDEGWTITSLSTNTQNSGLLPYGIITDNAGLVHVIITKYGWWTNGGELYYSNYSVNTKEWVTPVIIKTYNDRPVDNFTFHVGKTAFNSEGDLLCVYQRHGATPATNNLEIISKTAEGWQEPQIILEANTYSTYNRFDIDSDREGNYCIGYFEPWGENGPQINLSENSTNNFTRFEIFQNSDTLVKMSIHKQLDGSVQLYCNFKHSYPKILNYQDNILEISEFLADFRQEDSINVMRYLYPIQNKSNFSNKMDFNGFTTIYNGKDGNNVLPFYLLYVKTKLIKDITYVENTLNEKRDHLIYPNPVKNTLYLNLPFKREYENVKIYNSLGSLILKVKLNPNEGVNVSSLLPGFYVLQIDNTPKVYRFIKN
ncbi:MAG: T9SS type A sorting domain-containing protein [Bacteroidales bacterium]|nr:T9SS type A sorting domain-containing protein [Bacteroidales bacterium]